MRYFDLLPPCSYQGGKQRLSQQICDIIEEKAGNDFIFYDLCCGSGSVGLEMINRGHYTIFVDKGPYGAVWEAIGQNKFDIHRLQEEIDKLPEIEKIGEYLKELSNKEVDKDLFIYHYLLLQAGSFGSKQIWVKNNKWCNNTFRNYWKPTETSNRKSPVNPMMPMPDTLYNRVDDILRYSKGLLEGHNIDIFESVKIIKEDKRPKVIYIDPPYQNTTGYFESFDIFEVIKSLENEHLYVSEGFKFDLKNCKSIVLSEGRKKGNVSGTVKKDAVMEVLNIINGSKLRRGLL